MRLQWFGTVKVTQTRLLDWRRAVDMPRSHSMWLTLFRQPRPHFDRTNSVLNFAWLITLQSWGFARVVLVSHVVHTGMTWLCSKQPYHGLIHPLTSSLFRSSTDQSAAQSSCMDDSLRDRSILFILVIAAAVGNVVVVIQSVVVAVIRLFNHSLRLFFLLPLLLLSSSSILTIYMQVQTFTSMVPDQRLHINGIPSCDQGRNGLACYVRLMLII